MSSDFEDGEHTAFIKLPGDGHTPADSGSDEAVKASISHAAWRLHAFSIVTSLCEGTFGFVTDDYLNRMRTETGLATFELVTCGLWERVPGGYRIHDPETMELAILANDWINQQHKERDQ